VGTFAANGIDSSPDEAANKMLSKNNTYYYGGVEISVPLENNLAESQKQKASYEKEAAILSAKKIERSIITDVGNAFRLYATRHSVLRQFMEAAELQNGKLTEEEKRFRSGRSTTKTIIDYQHDDLSAQLSVALAIYEMEIAKVDLKRSMNVLLDEYGDRL